MLLPPKRVKPDKPGGSATAANGDGNLRIGTLTSDYSVAQTLPKLEVQEIHGDVVRLHPEEAEAGRLPRRIVFQEKPVSLVGLWETREWGRSKRQPILWMLWTGMAIAAVIVGAMMALPLINKPTRSGESGWVVEAVANAEILNDMLARRAAAERVFEEFIRAQSSEDMLPLVRDPEEVADLIRTDRRLPAASADAPRPKIRSWGAREARSLTYGILVGTLPDYSKFEAYFTVSNGRLVMDWKASTAYGTADFQQLMRKQGNPAEIRGWIEAAEFYTAAFPESSHQAYQLASPDRQQVIWAYAPRESGINQALKALIKGGYILEGRKEPQKVTVRLEPGPADSLPGQWAIMELLHKEWIAP